MFQLKVFVTVWLLICLSPIAKSEVKFKKAQVQIHKHILEVELAETSEQHAHGLMYRTSLPENSGMLFVFSEERVLSFWMKNTFIPLSIAYINKDMEIVDIQEMSPSSSVLVKDPPSYPSKKPAMYALEVNQGYFKKNNIKVKDKIKVLSNKGK